MDYKELVKQLRELLPEKVDYAKLVCAEGFAHGQHHIWEEPEPYAMEAAADAIVALQSELERVREHLDERGNYIDWADKAIISLKAELEQVKAERDAAVKDIESLLRDESPYECAICAFYEDCQRSVVECEKEAKWRGAQEKE